MAWTTRTHLLIAVETHANRQLVQYAVVGKGLQHMQGDQQTTLHVANTGAGGPVAVRCKRSSLHFTRRKDRVHVPQTQDVERVRRRAAVCLKGGDAPVAPHLQTSGKAEGLQAPGKKLGHGLDAGKVVAAAVDVDEGLQVVDEIANPAGDESLHCRLDHWRSSFSLKNAIPCV